MSMISTRFPWAPVWLPKTKIDLRNPVQQFVRAISIVALFVIIVTLIPLVSLTQVLRQARRNFTYNVLVVRLMMNLGLVLMIGSVNWLMMSPNLDLGQIHSSYWLMPTFYLGMLGGTVEYYRRGLMLFGEWYPLGSAGFMFWMFIFVGLVELYVVGWKDATLTHPTKFLRKSTTRWDGVYSILFLIGGLGVAAKAMTLGFFDVFKGLVGQLPSFLQIGAVDTYIPHGEGAPVYMIMLHVGLCFLVSDFLSYWAHRFLHTPTLWPLHEIHHSAEDFSLITQHRIHPFESVFHEGVRLVPYIVLGGNVSQYWPVVVVQLFWGYNGHSRFVIGSMLPRGFQWLRHCFLFPEHHWVHHGINENLLNKNLGSMLSVWDRLFHTYHHPDYTNPYVQIGVKDSPYNNVGFLAHLVRPLVVMYQTSLTRFQKSA